MSTTDSHIYPGEFVPSTIESTKKMLDDFNQINKSMSAPVNILDCPEHLNIEISIPGIEIGEILIETDNNLLTVYALHKEELKNQIEGKYVLHEFDHNKFIRKIKLPANADISFISACYNCGVLKLHVPKNKNIEKSMRCKIAVY